MFKKHWKIQGRRVPIETGAEAEVRELGLPLTNPLELIQEKSPRIEP
jgi:large subunit ribosomal protein L37